MMMLWRALSIAFLTSGRVPTPCLSASWIRTSRPIRSFLIASRSCGESVALPCATTCLSTWSTLDAGMGLPLTVATFCANDGRATIAIMANNRRAGFTIIYSILFQTKVAAATKTGGLHRRRYNILLHLCLFDHFLLVGSKFLLRQGFLDLRLHFFQLRQFGGAHVVQLDHVPADLGVDRVLGDLAFLQAGEAGGEFRREGRRAGPVQVAAVVGGAGVLRLLGQVFELGAALDLGDDRLGVGFVLDQDVAHVVFLVAGLLGEAVVFGLHFGVGDRVLLDVIAREGVDHDGLAGVLHCLLDFRIL